MLRELAQKVGNAKSQMLKEAAETLVSDCEFQILSAVAGGKFKWAVGAGFKEGLEMVRTIRYVKGNDVEECSVKVEHTFSKENIKKVGDGACPAIQRLFADVKYLKSPLTVSWVSDGPDVATSGNFIFFWD